MKILYLPGKSLKNKEEGENITSALEENGFEVYFHHWKHWDGDEAITLDLEMARLKPNISEEELVIIGKSLGSFFALQLIELNTNRIKQVILMGIPINDFDDKSELNRYPEILKKLDCPISVIQNINDDHGTPDQVKGLLEGVDYQLIIKERDDHRYYYPKDILSVLNSNS